MKKKEESYTGGSDSAISKQPAASAVYYSGIHAYRREIALFLSIGFFALVFSFDAGATELQKKIVERAQDYVGNGYCRGGISPPCFDCSGFVSYLISPHVSELPRVSRDMARYGKRIGRDDLKPGDLVFFATTPRESVISHVAIYIGQNSIIHAISNGPNRGVHITSLTARYWRNHYHSAGRVLPSSAFEERGGKEHTDKPIRFAKGTYTGELNNGEPNGKGKLELNNGDIYRGNFSNGLFDGKGTYLWENGARYEGQFKEGRIEGEGTYIASNGTRTSGLWKNGDLVEKSKRAEPGASSDTETADTKAASARETESGSEERSDEGLPGKTYLEEEDSPWNDWDGYMTGDFYKWREKEKDSFDEWKEKNQPR